jgi:hypothetical protein
MFVNFEVNERRFSVYTLSMKQKTHMEGTFSKRFPPVTPSTVHEVINSLGQPLNAQTRAYFEPRFGHDFSRIKVHVDEKAEESAKEIGASAYTVGKNIVFAKGHYQPTAQKGRQLIAHELTHVLQQEEGSIPERLEIAEPENDAEKEANAASQGLTRENDVFGQANLFHTGSTYNNLSRPILQRQTFGVAECSDDQIWEISQAHNLAIAMLTKAQQLSSAMASIPVVSDAAARNFKIQVPPETPWDEELWYSVTNALDTMLDADTEAAYHCESSGSLLCDLSGAIAISIYKIHLCQNWWNLDIDKRAMVLLHEWAHKWGEGVNRFFETYCSEIKEYQSLSAEELVETPDAYAMYIYEVYNNGKAAPCF